MRCPINELPATCFWFNCLHLGCGLLLTTLKVWPSRYVTHWWRAAVTALYPYKVCLQQTSKRTKIWAFALTGHKNYLHVRSSSQINRPFLFPFDIVGNRCSYALCGPTYTVGTTLVLKRYYFKVLKRNTGAHRMEDSLFCASSQRMQIFCQHFFG